MKMIMDGVEQLFAYLGPAVAEAAIELPESVDVSSVETLAGTVLVGLFAIWAVRKVVKLTNRS